MVDKLEIVKVGNKRQSKLLQNCEKVDTVLLKTDEKQDDVVQSKAAAFLKAAMQKEKVYNCPIKK